MKLNKTNEKISNFALIRFKFCVNPFYLRVIRPFRFTFLTYPTLMLG